MPLIWLAQRCEWFNNKQNLYVSELAKLMACNLSCQISAWLVCAIEINQTKKHIVFWIIRYQQGLIYTKTVPKFFDNWHNQ